MATSSITKNFVISGKEQVEMFVNAIEEHGGNHAPDCINGLQRNKGGSQHIG